jgi:hypothetical protein
MTFIDYGLSVLTSAIVAERVPSGAVVDLAAVFHRLSLDGRLAGHEVTQRFYEIGSPQGLRDLEEFLASRS